MVVKVLLAVCAFWVCVYAIMIIILMAGQTAMATFCTVLAHINRGEVEILDKIPLRFRNYNKLIIKECIIGPDGNLGKYAYMFQNGLSYAYNYDIQQIYPGLTNYYQFIAEYPINTAPPSFTSLVLNYTAIMTGNREDYPAVWNSA